MRAADAALGRVQSGPDAHLDAGQWPAVVGQPDRLRFVAGPRGAERRLGRPVGAEDDDPVLVLGAGQDARVEHGPAEVHGGEGQVGDAARRRLVHDPIEEQVGTTEERGARLHQEVEGGGVVEPVLERELRAEERDDGDRLQHPGHRRQRADHEQVVGHGERRGVDVVARRHQHRVQRVHHALGARRRARREDHHRRLVGIPRRGRRPHHRLGVPDGGHGRPARRAAVVAVGRDQRVGCERERRLGHGHDVADLRAPRGGRRDHHQRAGAQPGVDGDDGRDVVAHEQQQRVAGRDSLRAERGDPTVDRGVEVAVPERPLAPHDRDVVRVPSRGAAHEVHRFRPPVAGGAEPARPGRRPRPRAGGEVGCAHHSCRAPSSSQCVRAWPLDSEKHVTVPSSWRRSRRTRRPCGRWSSRPRPSGPTTCCSPTTTAAP